MNQTKPQFARGPPGAATSATFRDFIEVEIEFLTRQTRLLRRVTWWYLLPLYIGLVLITVGSTDFRFGIVQVTFCGINLTLCTGLFVFVWWLNQSGRKSYFEPLLNYYTEMRGALESGADFSLRLPEPPYGFLESSPQRPMTRARRSTWILLTLAITTLVACAGYLTAQHFDPRTGRFIAYTAPVVALLMIVASGICRRSAARSQIEFAGTIEPNEPTS